jgi:hypothetical protein
MLDVVDVVDQQAQVWENIVLTGAALVLLHGRELDLALGSGLF